MRVRSGWLLLVCLALLVGCAGTERPARNPMHRATAQDQARTDSESEQTSSPPTVPTAPPAGSADARRIPRASEPQPPRSPARPAPPGRSHSNPGVPPAAPPVIDVDAMTSEDLERALAELRVPAGALEAALTKVRRAWFVERDAFTRSYVRARLQGAGHTAALAACVEHARAVGIPVVGHPDDGGEDEAEVGIGPPPVTQLSPPPEVAPAAPIAPPVRSWRGLLAALWLLAVLSVIGLVIVTSTSPLEAPSPPVDLATSTLTGDVTQRVAVIGRAGSGKSVFLARLFKHFQEDVNLNPAASWTVDIAATDDKLSVDETEDQLRRSEWPIGPADFVVATARERTTGRMHQLLVSEASLDSAGVRPLDTRWVMLLIDGARVDAPEAWELDEFLGRLEMGNQHSGLPRASWLAMVITKADEFASIDAAPEQTAMSGLPEATLTRLRRCFRWVRVFAVSAVGKTLAAPDGQRLPDPHGVSVGLQEPLMWLLEGRKAYETERQARTVERQHAADDGESETLWAKQEAVRRARARRRRVGVAIILAAAVAAFELIRRTFG